MPDFSQLTDRQRKIYEFMRTKIDTRGFGPTVREIGEAFDIKSPNGVMCHLKALVKKGLISRMDGKARAIQLVGHRPGSSAGLPLLGRVAAGTPIQVGQIEDRLDLNGLFNDPNNYALQVRGQSMIDAHIDDGDYVVIRKQDRVENGACVVAMVNDEVTLKRYYRERDKIRLEPANGKMKAIVVHPSQDFRLLGVLKGVLRRL